MKSHRLVFLLIAGLVVAPRAVPADVVHLKSGVKLEGKVVDLGDEIKVEMEFGSRRIPKDEVLRIEATKPPKEEFHERLKTLDPENTEQHLALADWCETRSLNDEAKLCFERVIAENPDHDVARDKLGYKTGPDGKWRVKCEGCSGNGTIRQQCDKCKNGKIDCPICAGKGGVRKACTAEGCVGGRVKCPRCGDRPSLRRLALDGGMTVFCSTCQGTGMPTAKRARGGRSGSRAPNARTAKCSARRATAKDTPSESAQDAEAAAYNGDRCRSEEEFSTGNPGPMPAIVPPCGSVVQTDVDSLLLSSAETGTVVKKSPQQTTTDAERELALAVRRGEEPAWQEISRRYYAAVFGHCRRTITDPQDAQFAATEAMVSLFMALRKPEGAPGAFELDRPIWPWLARTAKNACIDLLRKNQRQPLLIVDVVNSVEEPNLPSPSSPDPLASAIGAEEAEKVRDCIKTRSRSDACEGERIQAAWLKFGLGWTYAEISEISRLPMAKVKWQVEAGRRAIEDCLREKGIM